MRTYLFSAKMVRREGIEPPSVPCKGTALPLDERRDVVAGEGVEPPILAYETKRIPFP
jgi:hypothetical protein